MGSMTPVVAMVVGAGAGLGLLLVIAGLRGTTVLPWLGSASGNGVGRDGAYGYDEDDDDPGRRAAAGKVARRRRRSHGLMAAALGLVIWLLTGWPALAILTTGAAGVVPLVAGGKRERQAWITKTRAIATWTEMLRDTMAAADGVEEAIAATVPIAPEAIRAEVAMLDARRRSEQPLADALAAFGSEVDHPSADLVVVALSAAAQGEGSDFVAVLTRLSAMTRAEVKMRLRVEASRAKMHSSSMIIVLVIGVALGLLMLLGGNYLDAYSSAGGQFVLLLAGGMMAAGLLLLRHMSRIEMPARFSPRRRSTIWTGDGAGGGPGAGGWIGPEGAGGAAGPAGWPVERETFA